MFLLTKKGNSPKKSEVYDEERFQIKSELEWRAYVTYLKFKVRFEAV